MILPHSGVLFGNKKEWSTLNATKWMNFENIMLSERNQVPRDHIMHDSIYVKCLERGNSQKQ